MESRHPVQRDNVIQRKTDSPTYYGFSRIINSISLVLFLFSICCIPAFGQELLRIHVSLSGLEGDMQNNALAHLSLARLSDSPALTDYLVRVLGKQAVKEIETALQPFGYYRPRIDFHLSREGDVWNATINVDPGKPVIVSGIRLDLKGHGSTDPKIVAAVSDFPLKKGDILNHQLYEAGNRNLLDQAAASGYINAVFIEHEIVVNREQLTAEIHLTLDTGAQYYFGKTSFDADFISHGLLARMLPYKEGDPYSSQALVRLRQSLYGSDYFDEVEVTTETAQQESMRIPVDVALTAKNPNVYGFGVGYGTDTGLRGTIEWTNRLLNSLGHQLKVILQPSERKSYFGGVYTIPIKDPRTDRLSLLAKWEKDNFDNTETEQRSLSMSYDHIREVGEYSLYLEFLDEDFDSGADTGHATLFIPGVKTTYRFADDRLVTKRGIRTTLELAGADQNLCSDASFLQGSLASKAIFSFLGDWRAIGRFQLGGTVVDDIYELPPSLRFYAGGDQSVRGYAYKSIAPRDSYGNVLGGQYLLTYGVELERSLTQSWSAAVFFDSGDAFNTVNDLAMKNGAGFGIRWNAPFGQVRLDLANAISEGGGSWRIHFNVGADL